MAEERFTRRWGPAGQKYSRPSPPLQHGTTSGVAEEGFRRRRWAPAGQKYSRPSSPLQHASVRTSVPSWEKKFCASVCNMSWNRLCKAKRFTCLYPDVLQWDDSAGCEAFHAAKSRYFAEISGLPSCAPLPDPDMFIDEVDHDAILDPELFKDLQKQPPHDLEENESKIRWDSFLFGKIPVPVSGWEEVEPPSINAIRLDPDSVVFVTHTGWGNEDLLLKCDTNDDSIVKHNNGVDPGNVVSALATGFCEIGETTGSNTGMASFCWDQRTYNGISANSSSMNADFICNDSLNRYY